MSMTMITKLTKKEYEKPELLVAEIDGVELLQSGSLEQPEDEQIEEEYFEI